MLVMNVLMEDVVLVHTVPLESNLTDIVWEEVVALDKSVLILSVVPCLAVMEEVWLSESAP